MKLAAISGSLRKKSFNTALLHTAVELAPQGVEIVAETIHGVPLYDADVEASEGIPPKVALLKDLIAGADGLILFTPEYNNSMPGVFKNAVDWLSTPSDDADRVFKGKPVALAGASRSGFGTILSQNAWLSVLRTLKTDTWFEGRLMISRAQTVFDADGKLTDERTRQNLSDFIEGFAAYVAGRRQG